jgi:hypothetical protein
LRARSRRRSATCSIRPCTRRKRKIAGEEIETFDLPWGSFHIWGATAGMLLTLREVLGEADSRGN